MLLVHGFLVIQDSVFFLSKFFMNVNYDLINGVSWSLGATECIFKFKRAPEREKPNFTFFDPDLFLAEFFTDVRYDFINGVIHGFLVIQDSCLFLPKIFMDVHYDLINGVSWSRGAKYAHFQVQTIPKAGKSNFIIFSCAIVHKFL
ncbi:hypothetical protein H5410_049611 [Solanum commersonii]|uniref:Uncharacterized protein n=1 Tax=Solanum commersonii TaxID=4109 RepID=A0A9J5WVH9_SOLCO|nr:hypothetical protein H5410_049611 [Solanum commersonii]